MVEWFVTGVEGTHTVREINGRLFSATVPQRKSLRMFSLEEEGTARTTLDRQGLTAVQHTLHAPLCCWQGGGSRTGPRKKKGV